MTEEYRVGYEWTSSTVNDRCLDRGSHISPSLP
jgi:hypothetical protein